MVDSIRRVAVLFGGPSPEHDVSILTGLQAARALESSRRYEAVQGLFWAKNGAWFEVPNGLEGIAFAEGPPPSSRPLQLALGPEGGFLVKKGKLAGRLEALGIDAALVCCHGGPGEDGALQGALDLAGIAYSGPNAAGAALGMDKLASGAVLAEAGLRTLPRLGLSPEGDKPDFDGPYIVKPRFGGSSIGIEVVADFTTALARLSANVHLRRGAVLEPYRPDLEDLQIAVRTFPEVELSAIERPLRTKGGEILDYRDKYVGGEGMVSAPREIPARLEGDLAARLRASALVAQALLGVRGVARIDFLAGDGELYVNEVNTIPGSLSRHLFVEPPLAFDDLLAGLLAEARERPAARLSAAGADGSVLRSAGAIDRKLG